MEILRERIVNHLDPDGLIDILDLSIEELVDILQPQIEAKIESFDFLEEQDEKL